jgi:gag-polyprotein putative aspartyl protease
MTPICFNRKLGAVVVTMLLYGGTSHAQSVADAARDSRAKQQSETSRRVFTNKDAPEGIPPATPPPSIAEPARKAAVTARHEIPYDPYEGSTQRVIINVTLNGRVQARLAVDTGAPETIISGALAERLGLMNQTSAGVWTRAGGIGGSTPAIRTIIETIRVGDIEQQFFPTTIVTEMSTAFEGLIGMDFLSLFVMHIDPARRLMILEDVAPTSVVYGQRNEQWWRSNYRELASLRRGWRDYAEQLNNEIESSNITAGGGIEDARRMLDFARRQAREAERLFDQLDRRAIQYVVPMNWRDYEY